MIRTINEKYVPRFTLRDCANWLLTPNHSNALLLDDQDRRFFVHKIKGPKEADSFFEAINNWRDSPDKVGPAGKCRGASALLYYFRHGGVDLDGFKPMPPPPSTRAKLEMIDENRAPISHWVQELKADPALVVRAHFGHIRPESGAKQDAAEHCGLFIARPVYRAFNPLERANMQSPNILSRFLKEAGFEKANGGNLVETAEGKQKLWILRSPET